MSHTGVGLYLQDLRGPSTAPQMDGCLRTLPACGPSWESQAGDVQPPSCSPALSAGSWLSVTGRDQARDPGLAPEGQAPTNLNGHSQLSG